MGWTDILGLGASAASGGVLGFLGAGVSSLFKYFNAKQEQTFRKEEWAHELDLLRLQQAHRSEDAENERNIEATKGSWQALIEAQKTMAPSTHTYHWKWLGDFVNAVKELTRPAISQMLMLATMLIFYQMMAILRGSDVALAAAFPQDKALEIVQYIVYSVVFAGATSWMFWFADRAFSPPGMKNR